MPLMHGNVVSTHEAIRVYVVDDHPMIRQGLAAMLASAPGVLWVGDAGDGLEALQKAPALRPDVVLVDLVMPRMDGLTTVAALRPLLPQARFVVLNAGLDPLDQSRAIAVGAAAFLPKSATATEVVRTLREVHGGWVAPKAAPDEPARGPAPGSDLTQRERELLSLMARGLSNLDIGRQLSIALPTVKFHVTNILAKLGADNRTEAVLLALRHQLVTLD